MHIIAQSGFENLFIRLFLNGSYEPVFLSAIVLNVQILSYSIRSTMRWDQYFQLRTIRLCMLFKFICIMMIPLRVKRCKYKDVSAELSTTIKHVCADVYYIQEYRNIELICPNVLSVFRVWNWPRYKKSVFCLEILIMSELRRKLCWKQQQSSDWKV